jgi:NAD(P)H-dependent flavin oxidoreductase YrpB (nitropropane dioxygenase family)
VSVRTDPKASPTGYPFRIVELPGERERAEQGRRICDIGYLRTPVRTSEGKLVYRCPAEPIHDYVAKGGDAADTVGRRCLCNGLLANVGRAQARGEGDEPPLITNGDDLLRMTSFLNGRRRYSARDVVEYLLA